MLRAHKKRKQFIKEQQTFLQKDKERVEYIKLRNQQRKTFAKQDLQKKLLEASRKQQNQIKEVKDKAKQESDKIQEIQFINYLE